MVHPLKTAKILEEAGMPPVVIVAGLNHDMIEDTHITIEELRKELGEVVADLVAFNTEDKEKSWEERKAHTIKAIKTGTLYQKALVIADKYANLQELILNHQLLGEDVWKSFKRGKEQQYWFYAGVAKRGKENFPFDEIPVFFLEYEKAVEDFFQPIK